jgi:hypothetical protein
VLVLVITILLAAIAVAAFPCWSHSARWGYVPSIIAGALLLCVATLVIGSKSAPKTANTNIAGLPVRSMTSTSDAFHHRMETASIKARNASR